MKFIKDFAVGSYVNAKDVGWVKITGKEIADRKVVPVTVCATGKADNITSTCYVTETALSCPGVIPTPTPTPPAPTPGAAFKIRIESDPSNAKLYIDNIYTNHLTPSDEKELKKQLSMLKAGTHTIKVTKGTATKYMEASQTVNIVDGDNGIIKLTLTTQGLPTTQEEIRKKIADLQAQITELEKLLK